jgi:hypothetical protein
MITQLVLNQPLTDSFSTSVLKRLKHHRLIIHENLEMTHEILVEYFENLNGALGRPINEVVSESNWTEDRKLEYLERFKSRIIKKETSGSWVDSNGDIVAEGTVGAIAELEFWQNLPRSIFPADQGKISEPVYNALLMNLSRLVARGIV